MRKVFNKDGILTTDPKKILQEIEKFYSDLYKPDSLKPSENLLNSFLANPKIPRLTEENAHACEGKLTVAECLKSLQLFENNKSPAGADPGEVKWVNFHPLFLSPLLSFFSYPSNIEIVFDFSGIITKIHPPFQNPRSAPGQVMTA